MSDGSSVGAELVMTPRFPRKAMIMQCCIHDSDDAGYKGSHSNAVSSYFTSPSRILTLIATRRPCRDSHTQINLRESVKRHHHSVLIKLCLRYRPTPLRTGNHPMRSISIHRSSVHTYPHQPTASPQAQALPPPCLPRNLLPSKIWRGSSGMIGPRETRLLAPRVALRLIP